MVEQNSDSVITDESKEKDEQDVIEVIDAEDSTEIEEDAGKDTSDITETEVNQLRKEKDEISERMLRIQAEFDNFKKRTQREKVAERQYRSQDLVTELLPALDNFERALEVEVTGEAKSVIDGISMVYRQIKDVLKAEDVEEIETVGKEFDPNLHHAVMQVEDNEVESNIVVEELQKGYILKDRVIRAAMVKVNK